MIGVLGIPNPLNLPGDLVRAIGLAIDQGISDAARWAVDGMTRALVATTSVDLHGWFAAPWSAMLALAAVTSGGILLVGVIHGALTGRSAEMGRRALGGALGVTVLAGPGALAAAGALVDATAAACGMVVHLGLGPGGFGQAFSRLPTDVGALPGTPLVVGALLAIVAGLLCFVIWVELAVRAGAIYLVVAFLPLGLAGLFWAPAGRWLRRLVETFVAVVASQLVITVVMVLAAADLSRGVTSATTSTARLDSLVTTVALLVLGSFSLPMALRLVPHAAEAAHLHGGGGRQAASATRAVSADSSGAGAVTRLTRAAAGGGAAGLGAVGVAVGAGALRRGLSRGAAAVPAQQDRGSEDADGTANGSGANGSARRDAATVASRAGIGGERGTTRKMGPSERFGTRPAPRSSNGTHPEDRDG